MELSNIQYLKLEGPDTKYIDRHNENQTVYILYPHPLDGACLIAEIAEGENTGDLVLTEACFLMEQDEKDKIEPFTRTKML